MVLMSAASVAALIYAYGPTVATVGTALGSGGLAIWTLGGFNKVLCPVCTTHVKQRDYNKHGSEHKFECPSCHEHVAFPDLEKHAQSHGFCCPVCLQNVPLGDFGPHLDQHREERVEDRRTRDEQYQRRLEELEREYEQKMADLDRAEAAFIQRREQARLLWEHLKSKCLSATYPYAW